MLKILVVCGNGLGSSFLMEMNINKVLKEIGAKVDVDHCDLTSAKGYKANIIVGTKDITSQLVGYAEVLVELNNILDIADMKNKVIEALAKFE
ncbi:MAG: PTS ascorbate transporter subunit IIB [Firmicutes bacterium HGW-Firmicutes-7]|nr:MAG: PTS ascorbate transporter subunit IIB [Firmicutes bacterium HGW-Firmicutes-7]